MNIWRHYFQENSGLWLSHWQFEERREGAVYDDVYLLARAKSVQGEDANGEVGTYTATFHVCPNPSTRLEIELGVPLDGRPLFTITADYSLWPKHQKLRVQSFGVRDDQETPTVGSTPYVLHDGVLHFLPLKQRIRHSGATAYGEILWRGDLGLTSVHHFDPAGRFDDLKPGWKALREFDGIKPPQRGPISGTVEAAKYTSVEGWHTALHTVALAKPIRTEIPTQIVAVVAGRLDIGTTTARRYMERWGPKTPGDLRNGKWDCDCHSCNP